MVCLNVQFYTKCTVLIIICAVLNAHYFVWGSYQRSPRPTGWILWRRSRRKGRGRKVRREKKEKGEGTNGMKMERRERESKGKEREEGRGREEFCAVVIFH